MPEPAFDPIAFKESTRAQWQRSAAAWHRWGPTLEDWLGPVTAAMLDLAQVGPGDRVLDVAAGAGEPALSAARQVGPTGFVLATDIAPNILAFAAQEARARGLGAAVFATRAMDGEHLDLADASFDAALSRLGLIYFPDRVRGLAEMRRVLKPGKRAVIASFTSPERNRYFSLPITVIRRRAGLPAPGPQQPGPFSLGDPAAMTEAFARAGFRQIATQAIAAPLRLPSTAACVQFEREAFGALQQMLSGLSEEAQAATWAEIAEELRQFEDADGFQAPAELRVGVGVA
jgi:ubiquinone/menaquinone biosynthesis C-methylase UbiE